MKKKPSVSLTATIDGVSFYLRQSRIIGGMFSPSPAEVLPSYGKMALAAVTSLPCAAEEAQWGRKRSNFCGMPLGEGA